MDNESLYTFTTHEYLLLSSLLISSLMWSLYMLLLRAFVAKTTKFCLIFVCAYLQIVVILNRMKKGLIMSFAFFSTYRK